MTRSHYVIILCALFSLPAHSGYVTFSQWIPWSYLSQELARHEVKVEEEKPSFSLSVGEWRPELVQVALSFRGGTPGLAGAAGNLHSDVRGSLALRIGGVRIDQIIRREFGGNVINVRVQASCAPITASLPSVTLSTTFSLETPDRLPSLRDLEIGIPAGSWSVSPVHCEGLAGIGEEIEASLNAALKNPALVTPMIRDWVTPHVNGWMREQWVSIADSGNWNDLHVSTVTARGFFLRGELPLSGAEDHPLEEELPDSSNAPVFAISREGYQALIADRLRALLPLQYDLRENDAFRKLLGSRFMQYLAWPDLRRFHPSTPFVLKNDPSSLRLSLARKDTGWKANVRGTGKLMTVIGGAPIDYLFYDLSADVPVKMELRSGDLYFTTGKAKAQLAWTFSPLYQLLYKPDPRIPATVLTSSLENLASSRLERVPLPRFSIGDREYRFATLNLSEKLVTLEWP